MINYNIKGKGEEEQDPDLLSSGGGERLGLVGEGEDEHLGLALVMSVYDYTSPSVEEFRARQAMTRLYYNECESSVASFHGRREWA